MALPVITTPLHVVEEAAYNAVGPVKGMVEDVRDMMVHGVKVRAANINLHALERQALIINDLIASGMLEASLDWKGKATSTLTELNAALTSSGPIVIKYAQQVGQAINDAAAGGTVLSSEDAQSAITMENADVDAIVGYLNTALGV